MSLISFLFLTLVSSAIFVTGDGQPLPTEPPEGGGGEGLETLPPLPEDDDVFIAFARVFSGCLRKGTSVYVLGPKHDPSVALQKVGYLILNKLVNKLDLNLDYRWSEFLRPDYQRLNVLSKNISGSQ